MALGVVLLFLVSPMAGAYHDIGVEWVNDYSWPTSDLHHCDEDARGFRDKITSDSDWYLYFEKSNGDCKDEHWQHQDDENYVDWANFAYYAGHGDEDELLISSYWEHAEWDNCRWGDERDGWLNWVALSCCEAGKEKFSNALQGVHLILGWKTSCTDTNYGSTFAAKMIDNDWPVVDAWFYAGDVCGDSGDVQRVLGENSDVLSNDHIYGHGTVCPDPVVDDDYLYLDNPI
ncbi:MAG: DUF6345 domain-containing protein [Thermoplasmatota archaeon]